MPEKKKSETKKKPATYADVMKTPAPKSIWDDDVDWYKVEKLSPKDKGRLFPNDFSPSGEPYGDF